MNAYVRKWVRLFLPNYATFKLQMVWNGGFQILREYGGGGAQHSTVTSAPPTGITSVALLVSVDNPSCFWSVDALRGPGNPG